jgi:hypothetical protein
LSGRRRFSRWIDFSEGDAKKSPKAQILGGRAASTVNALRITRSTAIGFKQYLRFRITDDIAAAKRR